LAGFWEKRRQEAISIAVAGAAMLLAFAVGGLLILSTGVNPLAAYAALAEGAFGNVFGLTETMVKATPLLFAGLGIVLAFRARVWNIGAEGQLYMGALAGTWVGINLVGLPAWIHLPITALAGCLAGGLWAAVPGLLRTRLRVNEVITTLMGNFIAFLFINYLVYGPMKDPTGYEIQSRAIQPSAVLFKLIPGTRFHAGFVLALLCAVAVHVLLWYTVIGYRIRAVGANPEAARYGGIKVSHYLLLALVLSGALAGLAGMSEISGFHYRLRDDISPGYGYTAIVVALLGRLHPLGVILAAILFAALEVGAHAMQRAMGIPIVIVYFIQGLVILCVLASDYLVQRRR